jgi:hypothetical protein
LIAKEYEDSNLNGTVDRIKLVFSENLDDNIANMT